MNTKHTWSTKTVDLLIKEYELGNGMELAHPFWNKDINWRKPYLDFQCTEEEVIELKRCKEDIVYFANNYVKVVNPTGLINLKLRRFQEEALRTIQENRFTKINFERQTGKTLLLTITMVHQLLFGDGKKVLCLSKNGTLARMTMDQVKFVLKELPFYMKPGIVTNNETKMTFDNGCVIQAQSVTKDAGKGAKSHMIVIDNMKYIDEAKMKETWKNVMFQVFADKEAKCMVVYESGSFNEIYDEERRFINIT